MNATQQQIFQAEKLITLIARAFYNDNVVVLLDALLFEKYIIEEELGPRLQISNKEVLKIKNQLEKEGLIRFENVFIDESKTAWKCYYIDYQACISIIRFRIYLMEQYLISEENTGLNEVYYECPTCQNKYDSLQVQRLITGDYKFVCSNCFPGKDIRTWKETEDYYKLKEVDNRKEVKNVQSLRKKLDEQLNPQRIKLSLLGSDIKSEQPTAADQEILLHEGIYDLLSNLKEVILPNNLPSDNINKGVISSVVLDKEMADEIAYNLENARSGKYGSQMKKKHLDTLKQQLASSGGSLGISLGSSGPKTIFDINILEEGAEASNTGYTTLSEGKGKKIYNQDEAAFEASKPEFLRGSKVFRANAVLQSLKEMQSERTKGNLSGEEDNEDSDEPPSKKVREDDNNLLYAFASAVPSDLPTKTEKEEDKKGEEEEEEDLEDIEWETEEA
jgi:transcription initiation factor IIE alpha subunit